MDKYILAIDQGTTGTTAMVFGGNGTSLSRINIEFKQYYPKPGWVEHDPEEIWRTVLESAEGAMASAGITPDRLAAIGITNQRETSVFWKKGTTAPLARAIVWQCRRSSEICTLMKEEGLEECFRKSTGLVLDPYFSGTKIKWMLDNDPVFSRLAHKGEVSFGTIDSWLLYRLTGGKVHATDFSNASRTLMYNINTLSWDDELLSNLGVPRSMLPDVFPSSGVFGYTDPGEFFGVSVPISGIAGDQQAALFGQACYRPGMTKSTNGTGSFVLMNTGDRAVYSDSGMLTTIAWGFEDRITYALEGSIFITGAAIQWLRDELRIINNASEAGTIAQSVESTGGVYFVPALTGLGAPYWDPYARGTIVGITRGTSRDHLIRAAVEAIAYQTRDVLDIMRSDSGIDISEIRADGGVSVMDFLLQFLSDLTGLELRRPAIAETTAMGAAFLAGLGIGFWDNLEEIESMWRCESHFTPVGSGAEMELKYAGWKKAVERALRWSNGV
ncbi:MAG: glycerol kinase GlpK [Actinobacteria bacterium]|nr:glycerol kinase GlpK [Actinomycetota bacterium]